MKLSRLFVLGAMGLMSLNVSALGSEDLIERTMPTPENVAEKPATFEVGKTYILYNTGAEMYFTQGSTWSTRGCVVPNKASAVKVRVAKYTIDNVWDGKTYEIQNYTTNRTSYSWYKMTMSAKTETAPGAMWLDQTGGDYETLYEIVGTEGNADVNGDGQVDVADISAIISIMAGTQNEYQADVNGDGTVDVADISAVISFMAANSRQLKKLGYVKAPSAEGPTYRFMPSSLNKTQQSDGTMFVGYAGLEYDSSNDTYDFTQDNGGINDKTERVPLTPQTTENVDWMFYSFSEFDAFEKSVVLKTLILKAETAGVDVTAAVNVYNNLDATVEQIEAAMKALNEALAQGIQGTADAPSDATVLITNPDFDEASSAGWSGDAPGWGANGQSPAWVAEQYNKTFNTYQDLYGMPAGVYGLSAYTTFRGSWDDYQDGLEAAAKLYATADGTTIEHAFDNMWSALNTVSMAGATEFGTTASENSQVDGDVTYYTPNDPSAARLYFEKGYYHNAVVFSTTDYTARIGVKNPAKNGTGDNWSIFDTFRLTYYGNEGAKSYKAWLSGNASLLYATEATVTSSYVDAFKTLVNGLSATDAAAANAAYAEAKSSTELADLKKNISLWGQYKAKVAEGLALGQRTDMAAYSADLVDYCEMDAEGYISEAKLTNEQIEAEIANIDEMMAKAIADAISDVQPGEDVTERYLKNADFEQGNTGWLGASSITAFNAGCAEAYEKNPFDLYQTVQGAKAGVYKISLQGFYRDGANETAYTKWKDAKKNGVTLTPVAWVYLNDNKTGLNNVFDIEGEISDESFFVRPLVGPSAYAGTDDEGNTWYFPNGMSTSSDCFDNGLYEKSAYGLVTEGSEFRIGITGNLGGSQWAIWDNFKLVYLGYEAQYMTEPLQEAIASIDLNKPMGKSVYKKANDAVKNAQSALESNDGQKMFDALSELLDLNAEIAASVNLFAELGVALEDLAAFASDYSSCESAGEALEFYETVYGNIQQVPTLYEDSEVEELMEKINEFYSRIRFEAAGIDYSGASELNPVEFTALVQSANFEDEEGQASSAGWQGTNVAVSAVSLNAEIFSTTPFDVYQTLAGLPAGKYRVSVKGFYRFGGHGPGPDYTAWLENGEINNNALLYATVAGGTTTAALARLAALGTPNHVNEGTVDDGWAEVGTDVGLYVPNNMAAAATLFGENPTGVTCEITVTVGDDGKLRIGLKKDEGVTNDWCIFDEWQLFYLGK